MYLTDEKKCQIVYQACRPGGAGSAMALPDFGRLFKPISIRGGRFAHQITTATTGFSDLSTTLSLLTAKHDLRPILTCRIRNSATQKSLATATARNLLF